MIEWGSYYGLACAAGIQISEMERMSLWEFHKAIEGWNKSNGSSSATKPPTDDEYYKAMERFG